MILQCILEIGSKSFSHLVNALERFLPLLKKFIISHDTRLIAMKVVREYWRKNPQNIIIVTDRLLTYKLIDYASVVSWVFSADERSNFIRSYIWDILRNTIQKILLRTEIANEELKSAEKSLEQVPKEEQDGDISESKKVKDRKAALEAALKEQKEMFLIIFQRFCACISEHLAVPSNSNSLWFKFTFGHLKEFGRKYRFHFEPFISSLHSLFSSSDSRVAQLFQLIIQV